MRQDKPGMVRSGPRHGAEPRVLLLAAVALLAPVASATADSVRVGGFWINEVSVERIEEGEIVYYSSGGSLVTKPLEELSGLRLEAYPRIGEAEDAIENENWSQAREKLRTELKADRPAWLKRWLRVQLTRVGLGSGQYVDAARRLRTLVENGAHAGYFAQLPLERLGNASPSERDRVAQILRDVEAKGDANATLEKLERAIGGVSEEGGADGEGGAGSSGPSLPMHSGVADEDEKAVKLLRQGKFKKALEQANHRLSGNTAGETGRFLYMRGLAQLGLLEQREDPAAHPEQALDVGLSFMRIPAHFPESSYAGHAWMEVGYVQALLGKRKKARELYERAAQELRGAEEKALQKRLEKLRGKLAQQDG